LKKTENIVVTKTDYTTYCGLPLNLSRGKKANWREKFNFPTSVEFRGNKTSLEGVVSEFDDNSSINGGGYLFIFEEYLFQRAVFHLEKGKKVLLPFLVERKPPGLKKSVEKELQFQC